MVLLDTFLPAEDIVERERETTTDYHFNGKRQRNLVTAGV